MTNTAAEVDDLGCAVLIDNVPLLPMWKPVRLTMASIEEYVGFYKADENLSLKIYRADYQLYARVARETPFGIFASEADEFFTKVSGTRLSFSRDRDGTLNGLILRRGTCNTKYACSNLE